MRFGLQVAAATAVLAGVFGCSESGGTQQAAARICEDLENEPSNERAAELLADDIERELRRGTDETELSDALDETCGRLIAALGPPLQTSEQAELADEERVADYMCEAMAAEPSGDLAWVEFEANLHRELALGLEQTDLYDALDAQCGELLAEVAPAFGPDTDLFDEEKTDEPVLAEEPEVEEDVDDDELGRQIAAAIPLPQLEWSSQPRADRAGGQVTLTFGRPYDSSIPLVVHNGTEDVISNVEITGQLRTSNGGLIASVSLSEVAPFAIEPDAIAVGYVWADVRELPTDAELQAPRVDYDIGLQSSYLGMQIDEFLHDPPRFTAAVSNPHDRVMHGPIAVTVACLGADGQIDTVATGFTDREDIEPGDSTTFTIEQRLAARTCSDWAAAVTGHTW